MRYIDIPAKVLEGLATEITENTRWPYDDGNGDPFWAGGESPVAYTWRVVATISQQNHSSYKTRKPYAYTAMDVSVGDYIANQYDGIALKIISIESKSDTELTFIVEDTLRYNTMRNPSGTGNGIFGAPVQIVIFELNEEDLPIIDPVPPSGVSPIFYPNLMSRFQNLEQTYNFQLHQPNHGFKVDDLIAADPANNGFVKANSAYPYIIGTVSYTDLGPDDFMINPIQKVVDDFPALIGEVGDVIYSDDENAGEFSLQGNHPVMIKLREYSNSSVDGTVVNPVVTDGGVFTVNGLPTTVSGTTGLAVANAINLNSSLHGVVARMASAPTSLSSVGGNLSYGEPVGFTGTTCTATINGVLVSFTTTTYGEAQYGPGYFVEEDMAFDINAANIPNIQAETSANILTIKNISGGSITIVNGDPDANGKNFAGSDSVSGLALSASSSTDTYLRLDAVDARAIDLFDTTGDTLTECGLYSVENGTKAAALYVEQGIRQAATYVVADIPARDSLNVLFGDQVYVQDTGNGEWAFYIRTFNDEWVKLSDKDSSETDAQSIEIEVMFNGTTEGLIHTISDGRRVTFVTVTVIEDFNGVAPTITIGDDGDNERLMTADQNDLKTISAYSTTPSYTYSNAGADTDIKYYLNADSSSSGRAVVAITYT